MPGCLVHLLHLAGVHPPRLAAASPELSLPQAAHIRKEQLQQQQPRSPHSPSRRNKSPTKAAQRQQQAEQLRAELISAASSFLTFLRLSLSDQVLGFFQADHDELWRDVLVNKPPWSDLAFVEVLRYHWGSTLKVGWLAQC